MSSTYIQSRSGEENESDQEYFRFNKMWVKGGVNDIKRRIETKYGIPINNLFLDGHNIIIRLKGGSVDPDWNEKACEYTRQGYNINKFMMEELIEFGNTFVRREPQAY